MNTNSEDLYTIEIYLNKKCNINCNFCLSKGNTSSKKENIDLLIKKLDDSFEKFNVLIFGGEPTIDTNFLYLIKKLNNLNKVNTLKIVTNLLDIKNLLKIKKYDNFKKVIITTTFHDIYENKRFFKFLKNLKLIKKEGFNFEILYAFEIVEKNIILKDLKNIQKRINILNRFNDVYLVYYHFYEKNIKLKELYLEIIPIFEKLKNLKKLAYYISDNKIITEKNINLGAPINIAKKLCLKNKKNYFCDITEKVKIYECHCQYFNSMDFKTDFDFKINNKNCQICTEVKIFDKNPIIF